MGVFTAAIDRLMARIRGGNLHSPGAWDDFLQDVELAWLDDVTEDAEEFAEEEHPRGREWARQVLAGIALAMTWHYFQGALRWSRAEAERLSARGAIAGVSQEEIDAAIERALLAHWEDLVGPTERARALAHLAQQTAARSPRHGTRWVLGDTENHCPICLDRDGEIRAEGWDDPPPLHPGCLCSLEIVALDEEEGD